MYVQKPRDGDIAWDRADRITRMAEDFVALPETPQQGNAGDWLIANANSEVGGPPVMSRFCYLLVILFSLVPWSASWGADRPNVIIILTDDQGYQDLGCFGSERIKTPRIDQMAKEGIRLTDFYAQAVCGPSRAALLTGCYPIRVGEPGNVKNQHTVLHSQEVTIAELLKRKGYATGCIGKWHLGEKRAGVWVPATMPNGQGFDEFYGTPLYNGFTVQVADTKFRSPIMRNDKVVVEAVENWDTITSDYTREAIAFIHEHRERPFFLYLAHNMPHVPLGASETFRGQSDYGPYGDAIEEIDCSTGEILDTLRELSLDQKTLVIFTSDNGPWIETTRGDRQDGKPFIPRNHSGVADPLRGYKMLTWEGGLRVPCVVWWPGTIPADRTCRKVAATIDLLPTIAKLAGAELAQDRVIDGHDIWPLLTDDDIAASPHDETGFFYYRYTALEAVRSGRWKLVLPRPEHPPWTGWSGRFDGSGVNELTLFDLESDVGEVQNVAADRPEIVARLMRLVEKARQELGDYDQVGSGARFFDEGVKRPELFRKPREDARRKPMANDLAEPIGNLRFDLESGDLSGWTIVEGEFDQIITKRTGLPNHPRQPFNKQGDFLLFTGHRHDREAGDDSLTGVIESPAFRLRGERLRFLIGGGDHPSTYVALCTDGGRELMTARGGNGPVMKRIDWDVSDYQGQTLKLRIVDRSRWSWGHVTFDDFSCDGERVQIPDSDESKTP